LHYFRGKIFENFRKNTSYIAVYSLLV